MSTQRALELIDDLKSHLAGVRLGRKQILDVHTK